MSGNKELIQGLIGQLSTLIEDDELGEQAIRELARQKIEDAKVKHSNNPEKAEAVGRTLNDVLDTLVKGIFEIKKASIDNIKEIAK